MKAFQEKKKARQRNVICFLDLLGCQAEMLEAHKVACAKAEQLARGPGRKDLS